MIRTLGDGTLVGRDPGVVEQHVDAAEIARRGVEHLLELGRDGHVGGDEPGGATEPLGDREAVVRATLLAVAVVHGGGIAETVLEVGAFARGEIGEHDARALGDEAFDRRQPHARRAAGDDGDLPVQPAIESSGRARAHPIDISVLNSTRPRGDPRWRTNR